MFTVSPVSATYADTLLWVGVESPNQSLTGSKGISTLEVPPIIVFIESLRNISNLRFPSSFLLYRVLPSAFVILFASFNIISNNLLGSDSVDSAIPILFSLCILFSRLFIFCFSFILLIF